MIRYIDIIIILLILAAMMLIGCGTENPAKDTDFHTSGSKEADQRAEQQIAKTQQMRGESLKGEKSDAKTNAKPSLYERLGGEKNIRAMMDDWLKRCLADPRVNWERKGIKQGGVLGVGAKEKPWDASPANVEQLSKHLAQLVTLASGGPAHYDGREIKSSHESLEISNAEFDAATGDLKATLDAARVPVEEQKELLSIIESTRSQIVTVRGND